MFPDARLGKSHSLSAHHPFLLLVQGDIPQPSRKGYVSEAGLDGVEGTDSSAAPTWVLTSQRTSMMLDAIYPVGVLFWNNKRSLETKDLGGSRLFISSSSSRFILLSTCAKTKWAFANCDGSDCCSINCCWLAGNQTWCLTRCCSQLHSDFRNDPNMKEFSHWMTSLIPSHCNPERYHAEKSFF